MLGAQGHAQARAEAQVRKGRAGHGKQVRRGGGGGSRRARHGAGRATMGTTWACLCAGWACWLGQLGQFGCLVHLTHFDLVFGPSTVPELLNEHYSSPKKFSKKKILNKFFEKSNKIKSNKKG